MFYVLSEYSVENNFQDGRGKKGGWEIRQEIIMEAQARDGGDLDEILAVDSHRWLEHILYRRC